AIEIVDPKIGDPIGLCPERPRQGFAKRPALISIARRRAEGAGAEAPRRHEIALKGAPFELGWPVFHLPACIAAVASVPGFASVVTLGGSIGPGLSRRRWTAARPALLPAAIVVLLSAIGSRLLAALLRSPRLAAAFAPTLVLLGSLSKLLIGKIARRRMRGHAH